jgi:hypothetical protein
MGKRIYVAMEITYPAAVVFNKMGKVRKSTLAGEQVNIFILRLYY